MLPEEKQPGPDTGGAGQPRELQVAAEVPKKAEEQAVPLASASEKEESAPLTHEEFAAKLEQLSARARAAGMSPLRTMLSTYAKQGMTMIDGFLSALEEGAATKKPSATETKAPDKEKG